MISALISLAVLLAVIVIAAAAGFWLGGYNVPAGEPWSFAPVVALIFGAMGCVGAVIAIILNYAWGGWW